MSPSRLHWLPAPPADFKQACRSVLTAASAGAAIRALASTALDVNQLMRLATTIEKAAAAGRCLEPLDGFRLGYLSNSTSDFITPAITATAPRHNLHVECVAAGYDQAVQEGIDPCSRVNCSRPDAVLIALDFRAFPFRRTTAGSPSEFVDTVLARLQSIRDGVKSCGNPVVILQNLAAPAERVFGSFDRVLPGTRRHAIDCANAAIAESARGWGDVLLDVAGIAENVGLANWHAPREWNIAKLPFAQEFAPLYADHVCRTLAALRGKSRRCAVVDLDNTLWGGVIGDDGVQGISVSRGDATGEAFLDFQRYLLSLRDRGIVLAVCSKNEDGSARLPFREHPEMILREEHFAAFQANWSDKASNIQAIAALLDLGLESFVFIDDNPFERQLVRQALPAVAVPELGEDPSLFARIVSDAGYFEAVAFSEEDGKRASYYEGNARRAALQENVGNLDAYLASLDMEIRFAPFDATSRARVTQLINKSNQFNLTTRRYSEAEVAALQSSPEHYTLQARLTDTFGDNGLISVVICRAVSPQEWEIDTWLMSCRVLGRKVEHAVLREILAAAAEAGVRRLVGSYIPTERNTIVEQHYPNLGFRLLERCENGVTRWLLDVATARVEAPLITVHSERFRPLNELAGVSAATEQA